MRNLGWNYSTNATLALLLGGLFSLQAIYYDKIDLRLVEIGFGWYLGPILLRVLMFLEIVLAVFYLFRIGSETIIRVGCIFVFCLSVIDLLCSWLIPSKTDICIFGFEGLSTAHLFVVVLLMLVSPAMIWFGASRRVKSWVMWVVMICLSPVSFFAGLSQYSFFEISTTHLDQESFKQYSESFYAEQGENKSVFFFLSTSCMHCEDLLYKISVAQEDRHFEHITICFIGAEQAAWRLCSKFDIKCDYLFMDDLQRFFSLAGPSLPSMIVKEESQSKLVVGFDINYFWLEHIFG